MRLFFLCLFFDDFMMCQCCAFMLYYYRKGGMHMYNYQSYMTQANTNAINWVCGYEGAKQYPLRPNGAVVLLDNESDKMYIKTCDNIGMCTVRTFSFKEEKDAPGHKNTIAQPTIDESKFVTRTEYQSLLDNVQSLINTIGGKNDEPISTTQSKQPSAKQYNSNVQR